LDELLAQPVDRGNLKELIAHVYDSYSTVDLAHSRVRQMEADLEKLEGDERRNMTEKIGVLQFAMGDYEDAVETLSNVRNRKTASHFLGRAYLKLGREQDALAYLEKGSTGDDQETDVYIIEALCRLRRYSEAEKILKKYRGSDQPADVLYARGCIADAKGDYEAAIGHYEAALEKAPDHAMSLFRLALSCDLNGDDDRALELYQRCVNLKPTYVGALINLGVLYEDRSMYNEAIDCYKRVLAIDPRHRQAQLYLKDAESSLNMFIDLSRMRRMEYMKEVFSLPVSNFELSARSRTTLDRMDVKTLGGLTRITRDELLNEKNFGDTSLTEIESLLSRYDLELGARLEPGEIPVPAESIDDEELREKLNIPVAELDLSTRCRKCMERLGINVVGEVTQMTEAQLLDTPNFGATSLQEVKDKLAELGLSLKSE